MAIPFEGTTIGADGVRYDSDDPDIPVDPPSRATAATIAASLTQLDLPSRTVTDAVAVFTVPRTVTDAVIVDASDVVTSAAANFTSADLNAVITNAKFPTGTYITEITDEATVVVSNPASSAGTGQTVAIAKLVKTLTSTAANFTAADVGATVTCAKYPDGTVIDTVTDEATVVLSEFASSAGTGQTAVIDRTLDSILDDLEARVVVLEP